MTIPRGGGSAALAFPLCQGTCISQFSLYIYTHTQATLPEVPYFARYILLDVTTINFPSFPFLPVLKGKHMWEEVVNLQPSWRWGDIIKATEVMFGIHAAKYNLLSSGQFLWLAWKWWKFNPAHLEHCTVTWQHCHGVIFALYLCPAGQVGLTLLLPWAPAPIPPPPVPDYPSIPFYFTGSDSAPIRRQDSEEYDSGLAHRGGEGVEQLSRPLTTAACCEMSESAWETERIHSSNISLSST